MKVINMFITFILIFCLTVQSQFVQYVTYHGPDSDVPIATQFFPVGCYGDEGNAELLQCTEDGVYGKYNCNTNCTTCVGDYTIPFGRSKVGNYSCISSMPSIPSSQVVITYYNESCSSELVSEYYTYMDTCLEVGPSLFERQFCISGTPFASTCTDAACTQCKEYKYSSQCQKEIVFSCGFNITSP